MGYALADNVRACAADGTIYFLDIARDRYCRAGPSASEALLSRADAKAEPVPALDAMVGAGLLTYKPGSGDIALCSHPSPVGDLHSLFPPRPPARLADVSEVAILAAKLAWRLRRCGFAAALRAAEAETGRHPAPKIAIDQLACAVGRFQCARSLLPTSPRCLLDSLILKSWTAARGIATHLVIGIRPLPFAAHCWVERDGVVLNGSHDGIANFVPICVL